jgi:pimeloyl-ACP methyl ester carboxylesterase
VARITRRGHARRADLVSCCDARTLDDYADQVHAVAEHVGACVDLVGFSWGGATSLRVAAAAPELVDSVAVIEPEAYEEFIDF